MSKGCTEVVEAPFQTALRAERLSIISAHAANYGTCCRGDS